MLPMDDWNYVQLKQKIASSLKDKMNPEMMEHNFEHPVYSPQLNNLSCSLIPVLPDPIASPPFAPRDPQFVTRNPQLVPKDLPFVPHDPHLFSSIPIFPHNLLSFPKNPVCSQHPIIWLLVFPMNPDFPPPLISPLDPYLSPMNPH